MEFHQLFRLNLYIQIIHKLEMERRLLCLQVLCTLAIREPELSLHQLCLKDLYILEYHERELDLCQLYPQELCTLVSRELAIL